MQQEEVLQNTYYQPKGLNPTLLNKQIKPFRFTEASTHRLSQNDLITEPTMSGIQTDRTHLRNIRQLIRPLKQTTIEPVSNILAEEKIKLQHKFILLDNFTTRHSQHQVQENERKYSNPTFSISEQESLVTLYRNQFFYTSLRIKDRYSPMILQLIIKQGDPNTRLRIFASPKFIQPNRFNAVAEVSGRQLKYASNSELFTEETLYIAILAVHELQVAIRVEFGRPATKRVQRERKEKSVHEFPPDLELQVEEIMLRRRLRYANQQNYVELNKCSQISRRVPQTQQTPKRVEVRQKLLSMKTEQNLKRMAQMQVHDIAKQIHRRQLEMQRDIRQREYVQKSWLRVIWLVNVLAPRISDIIDNQRRLVAKNMKKQIFLIQLLRKMQKRVQKFGPTCKLRTILHGKYTLNAIALNSREVAKKRAQKIMTQILQSNIVCFTTESKGTHVVNLSN